MQGVFKKLREKQEVAKWNREDVAVICNSKVVQEREEALPFVNNYDSTIQEFTNDLQLVKQILNEIVSSNNNNNNNNNNNSITVESYSLPVYEDY